MRLHLYLYRSNIELEKPYSAYIYFKEHRMNESFANCFNKKVNLNY